MRLNKRTVAAVVLLAASMPGDESPVLAELTKGAAREPFATEAEPIPQGRCEQDTKGDHSSGLMRTLRPRLGGHCPLAFSPDGKTLAAWGGYDELCLWNVATGEQRSQLRIKQNPPPSVKALAFSPDGKTLAAGYSSHEDKLAVRLWDVDTGKVARELRVSQGSVIDLAFAPDGKTLAGAKAGGEVYLWETTAGKELHRLKRADAGGGEYGGYGIAFSPDGKTVAAGGGKVTIWDVATGKKRWQFAAVGYFVAFLPNGKTLAAAGAYYPPQPEMERLLHQPTIYLWDIETGKERRLVQEERQGDFRCLAASPDGRMLVTGGPGGELRLWEVATGKERGRLERHDSGQFTAAFSSNGRMLATSAGDGKIHIRDVLQLHKKQTQAGKPTSEGLRLSGTDLASADAAKAYRAVCDLVHWSEYSLPFLEEHFRRLPQSDPRRVAELITDLDSKKFEVRQKATVELEKHGDLSAGALRQLLERTPSLELRRRAEQILEKLDGPFTSPDRLRAIRGVEVLEHIGTPEAQRVLAELARGMPGTDLTEGAKAALARLKKRAAIKP